MDIIFYHKDCKDGFGAAWAAYLAKPDATFIPIAYTDNIDLELVKGNDVYFLDFCPNNALWHDVFMVAKTVIVIDHHKSAYDRVMLINPTFVADGRPHHVDNGIVLMDMNHSGAYLSYVYFNLTKALPKLISYIEDRDLWRWRWEFSREISAYINLVPFDFYTWGALAQELENADGFNQATWTGSRLLAMQAAMVGRLADEAFQIHLNPSKVAGAKVRGMACNVPQATMLQSEVCEELLRRHPDAQFAACYSETADNNRRWSIRSRNVEEFDCQAYAKNFPGGGGHPCAAGWSVPAIRAVDRVQLEGV